MLAMNMTISYATYSDSVACPVNQLGCPLTGICVSNSVACNGRADCTLTQVDESPILCGKSASEYC